MCFWVDLFFKIHSDVLNKKLNKTIYMHKIFQSVTLVGVLILQCFCPNFCGTGKDFDTKKEHPHSNSKPQLSKFWSQSDLRQRWTPAAFHQHVMFLHSSERQRKLIWYVCLSSGPVGPLVYIRQRFRSSLPRAENCGETDQSDGVCR